jgi:hypothetical protein
MRRGWLSSLVVSHTEGLVDKAKVEESEGRVFELERLVSVSMFV